MTGSLVGDSGVTGSVVGDSGVTGSFVGDSGETGSVVGDSGVTGSVVGDSGDSGRTGAVGDLAAGTTGNVAPATGTGDLTMQTHRLHGQFCGEKKLCSIGMT